MALNTKQKQFCKEYVKDFNATQAAKRSGYSEKTARQIGSENLSKLDIQIEIKRLLDKRKDKIDVSPQRIIAELKKIAFADLGHFMDVSDDGAYFHNLDNLDTSIIKSVTKITNTQTGHTSLKFELFSKEKALKMLGQYKAMYKDKIDVDIKKENSILNTIKDIKNSNSDSDNVKSKTD